ncbi:MAG: hypothetical protein ABWK00_04565 [Desulfurococcaceae archaeon]
MASVKKIVLVTATHHPYHDLWVRIAKRASEATGKELDVRLEDYVFLTEHGDVDDLGMAWLPQIVLELDDGTYRVALSRLPLNESLQPDEEGAVEAVVNKIREAEGGEKQ